MHPTFLQLGHFKIPLVGLCVAVGLMCALTLCQVTARLVRLDPVKVWDAALTMAFAAFALSRILLVIGSWRSFLSAPLLLLALPSLNDTGVLLTALVTAIYLRWKGLPLLGFLDAMTPCFTLLWAFVNLGDILSGTKEGMPTHFFIAVGANTAGNGGVHPVEAYTLLLALVLTGMLIRALTGMQQKKRHDGMGFALGLVLAGSVVFLMDFLRLPSALYVAAMLDPVQWMGLAMIVVGFALWIAFPEAPESEPVAQNGSPDAV